MSLETNLLVTCDSYFTDLKPVFGRLFLEFLPRKVKKDNFTWGEINIHRVRLNSCQVKWNQILENAEKLKILLCVAGTFGDHLWSAIILLAIFDGSHSQESQKWLPWLYCLRYMSKLSIFRININDYSLTNKKWR